jgi:hypothetical protein
MELWKINPKTQRSKYHGHAKSPLQGFKRRPWHICCGSFAKMHPWTQHSSVQYQHLKDHVAREFIAPSFPVDLQANIETKQLPISLCS